MRLAICLIFLLSSMMTMGQDKNNYELSGVCKYTYNAKGERSEELNFDANNTLIGKNQYVFDEKGNIIKSEKYLADGTLSVTSEYTYDDENQVVTSVETDHTSKKTINEQHFYNNLGEKMRTEYRENNQLIREVHYHYSAEGDENVHSDHDSNGVLTSAFFTSYKYDDLGNVKEKLIRDSEGVMIEINRYKYDDKLKVSTCFSVYNTEGKKNSKCEYQFDANGREIGFKLYVAN